MSDEISIPTTSQSEAEAGVINDKAMTPLRTKQAIDALGVSQDVLASSAGGEMVGLPDGISTVADIMSAEDGKGAGLVGYSASDTAEARKVQDEMRDRPISIMSYYKPSVDGSDFAPAFGRAIDAGERAIFLPVRAGGYDIASGVGRALDGDLHIDANGQALHFGGGGKISLSGQVVATGRVLATDAARYVREVTLDSGAAIQRGDILHINTSIKPAAAWDDTKQDCVRVADVAGATIYLDAALNFHYTTDDAVSITIYRPHRFTLTRAIIHVVEAVGTYVPRVGFELEGLDGITITRPRIHGDLPFDRTNNIYRRGIYIYRCWNWLVEAPDAEAMSYTLGVYGGSRYGTERDVTARYCHHANADVGNFASDYWLDGLSSQDCYQALNTHPAFRCHARNCDVRGDYGLSNWRVFGGSWTGSMIQSSVDDTAELPQFQNIVPASGYEYLNADADFSAVDVTFDVPNRPSKTPFGVRFGRTVYWSRVISANGALCSYNAGEVDTLVIGPGNEFGATRAGVPPVGEFGSVRATTVRFDASAGRQHSVASAATISLPIGIDVVTISGTTDITEITATGHAGRRVTLVFSGILTVVSGGNLRLAGDFVTAANSTLTLVCGDGANWTEQARSAN